MFRIPLSAALAVASLASVVAQCPRPPIPVGGFEVVARPVETITYSDGAVAEGALRVPAPTPPACGWPLVVYVHSLASNRDQDLDWQVAIAARGYAVWSYDVRGQGVALRRSGPRGDTTLFGGDERFDLAEQILHVGRVHAGLVDPERVAIVGDSQGGVHGWMAAVQSGRPLKVRGRGELVFPRIACIAPADYVPEPTSHRIRGGRQFAALFLDTVDPPPGIDLRVAPALRDRVLDFFEQDDPAGCEQFLLGDPNRAVLPRLTDLDVPVLCRFAWHDSVCGARPLLEAFASIPSTTPARLIVSTIGHGTPFNAYEQALKRDLVDRWLDRFLWLEDNGVDREPRFVFGLMPIETGALTDRGTLWSHTFIDELPGDEVATRRLWLGADGSMGDSEPAAPATAGRVVHRNLGGVDRSMWRYEREVRTLGSVLDSFPMSEVAFRWTVPDATELVGTTRVSLAVRPDAQRYALCALLSARAPGSGEVMLAHWGTAVRDATPGAARRDEFDLAPIAARLPAGTEVKLVIRNLWVPEAPHVRGLVAVPEFEPSDVELLAGPGTEGSWCDLPLRPVAVSLVANRAALDFTAPERVELRIDAGALRGGLGYVFGGSGSGQLPGLALPGGILPVRVDPWFEVFGWIANTAEFPGFAGTLDADGRAAAALDLTALPALPSDLLGRRFTFAAWVYSDPVTLLGAPSNPVEVVLR